MMCNNPKLDLVNMNAHIKFGKNICLFDLILYVPSTIFQLYRDRVKICLLVLKILSGNKFWHKSRAITLVRMWGKWHVTIPS